MKVIGIIPARYASTRLPGKPLLLIKGKPMIQRVYEQASKSKYIDLVVVATDDKRIFKAVKDFNGEVVMTSEKHLSGTDRINEAAKNYRCDLVVNIQGDEPFIDSKNIDAAIAPLIKNKKLNVSTLAVAMSEISDVNDVNKVKVVMDERNNALYFSRSLIPYSSQADRLKVKYYKHIGLYVYRKKFLKKFSKMKPSPQEIPERLEQLRILYSGEKINVVVVRKDTFSIDTRNDLEIANQERIDMKLTKITKKHKPGLMRMLNNEKISCWLCAPPFPYKESDAREFIKKCRISTDTNFSFAMETKGKHIGGIGLHVTHGEAGFIGYYIDEKYWGKGYGREAIRQILKFAFEKKKLKMVYAYTFEGNTASQKLLTNSGFVEKHNPKILTKNGQEFNSKYFEKFNNL